MDFNRRNLLKALGLAGPAYFLPSAMGRRARAASSTIPTRILFFYTPHGTLLRQWIKAPAGASTATETNYDLGPILQPLAAFKQKMLVITGLGMYSTDKDPTPGSNGHIGGQTHALSAINRANANAAGGISIDQLIAQGINSPAPVTQLPSLELSARANAGAPAFATSWAGSNALVPAMTDPAAVFKRLFPSGPPSATQPSSAQIQARRRKSVLDGVLAEFNALSQPLSPADKTKLDSHATLIRDLEQRIALVPSSTNSCTAPDQTLAVSPYQKDCPSGTGANCLTDAISSFTSLAVSAFACDLTRVITFDIDQLASSMFGVDDIHGFLHGVDDNYWYVYGDNYGGIAATAKDPNNIAKAVKFYSSYAQFLANLLQQLDAIKEPDGSTVLDHTMVLWCGEIGTSNHSDNLAHYVLAGGGQTGFLKTGRYLKIPQIDSFFGAPHNNLMVSLANGMGLPNVTTFGNPKTCTGPLTQLKG